MWPTLRRELDVANTLLRLTRNPNTHHQEVDSSFGATPLLDSLQSIREVCRQFLKTGILESFEAQLRLLPICSCLRLMLHRGNRTESRVAHFPGHAEVRLYTCLREEFRRVRGPGTQHRHGIQVIDSSSCAWLHDLLFCFSMCLWNCESIQKGHKQTQPFSDCQVTINSVRSLSILEGGICISIVFHAPPHTFAPNE